jgi:hypothetical protein
MTTPERSSKVSPPQVLFVSPRLCKTGLGSNRHTTKTQSTIHYIAYKTAYQHVAFFCTACYLLTDDYGISRTYLLATQRARLRNCVKDYRTLAWHLDIF